MQQSPFISIILLAFNHLDYTRLCVESLYKHTSYLRFELITINNGSSDGTDEYFNGLPNEKKIAFSQNVGVPRAFNEGLKLTEGEYTVFLSNDLVLTPNWLDNLVRVIQADDRIGMVVPVSNIASYYQQLGLNYSDQEELELITRQFNRSNSDQWEERVRLASYLALFRTRVLKELEGFEETYRPCVLEEEDLSFRIRRAGYKLILAKDTFIHHFGSQTKQVNYADKYLVERNRRIFSARFGVEAWEDTEIDFELVEHTKDGGYGDAREINVLGICSNCGATVLQVKNRLRENGARSVKLWTFTSEEKYLKDLETISEGVVFGKLDNIANAIDKLKLIPDQGGGKKFDLIILEADFSSLANPIGFLQSISRLIKKDGQFVCSIHNELYYVNLLRLLGGYSDYSAKLRTGFNYPSTMDFPRLASLFQKVGFEELKIVFPKVEPPPEHAVFLEKLRELKRLSRFGTSELPYGLTNDLASDNLFSTKRFILSVKGVKDFPKILLYSGYDYLQKGLIFEDKSFGNSLGVDTGENFMGVLKQELTERGYQVSTLDELEDIDDAELILFYDVPKHYANHCFWGMYQFVCKGQLYFEEILKRKAQGKSRTKLAVILNEPPCVMPENYDPSILAEFDCVLTYDDDLVDNHKYYKFYTPQPEAVKNPYARSYSEKKLCTFVGANKSSLLAGELYSERRKAILFFEENHRKDFDFYGKSWEGTTLKSYKGEIANKLEVLSRYRFCICYENGSFKGWISEKIFDCFFAGCVPIYLGAPNIREHIPSNTFIDRRAFASDEELYRFIKTMNEDRYQEYLQNIETFLKSDGFIKFTRQSVVKDLINVLTAQFEPRTSNIEHQF